MTLGRMLDDSARKFHHRACLMSGAAAGKGPRRSITYGELADLSDRYARAMYDLGIRKGERVAIWTLNCPEFVVAYYGNAKLGAISVPINCMFTPEEAHYILADSGAQAIVAHAPFEPALRHIWQRLPELEHGILIPGGAAGADSEYSGPAQQAPTSDAGSADAAFRSWHDLLARGADALAGGDSEALEFKRRVLSRDIAVFLYTSGTTGHPKGAMLSHRNLLWDSRACQRVLDLHPTDIGLCVLPMFHSFAQQVFLVLCLSAGVAVVIQDRFVPARVLQEIHERGATIFGGVPSMYAMLLQVPREQRPPMTTLRYCVCGGAPLPAAIFHAFQAEFGIPIIEGDGPTECSPVVSVTPPDGPFKVGSVGPPLPGVQVRILDDHDREVRAGEIGEIVVKAPSVMVGYHNQPEATAEAKRGGWFHTGDMGRVDEDGYIYIVDRKKNMLISSGLNVYPREVEEVLYRHPAVAEAAVLGMPDELRGEVPVAYVALAPGQQASEKELIAFCREHLARFKVPRKIEFRPALPKSATGKILRRELSEWH